GRAGGGGGCASRAGRSRCGRGEAHPRSSWWAPGQGAREGRGRRRRLSGDRRALRPLPPDFYARAADDVARDLLSAVLASTTGGALAAARIVETEAYMGPHDPASHAAERIGRTARPAAMCGPPGAAYASLSCGLRWCPSAGTGVEGCPAAVWIRAVAPPGGIGVMRRRRWGSGGAAMRRRPARGLTAGPARLAEALAI